MGIAALVGLVAAFYSFNNYIYEKKQADAAADYKDATYLIEGERVTLKGGMAEQEAAPGSASKVVTRYFGNEVSTDLDGDGRDDVAFLVTQDRGGSGTFFYVVAALQTDRGYVGSDGYLLGDRIAPQTTGVSQNPRHKHVIVVNYADRAPGEPMSAQPSVGKSVYLKLDPSSRQWGIVMLDFEGESDGEPYRATLSGEYVCLPHRDGAVRETEECAPGVKTDAGEYYAIDFYLMSQEHRPLSVGERFSANGLVTPIERLSTNRWQKYQVEGIFSVTDSVRVGE